MHYEVVISEPSVDETTQDLYQNKPPTPMPRLRNDRKMILTAVNIDIGEDDNSTSHFEDSINVGKLEQKKYRCVPEELSSTLSTVPKESIFQSPFGLKKCESFPNILNSLNHKDDIEENFYKIPRCLKRNRLSQSLKDFEAEDSGLTPLPNYFSIDRINYSKTKSNSKCTSEPTNGLEHNDHTNKRKNLRSFLKKPRDRIQTLKTRFDNIMNDQAALQRVGAFEDKPKVTINIDEILKNSKMKCKGMMKSTSKFFHRKKESTNRSVMNSNEDITRQSRTPIRTELKASDIEYRLNTNDRSVSRFSDKENEPDDRVVSDVGLIKSKFGKINPTDFVKVRIITII